ncbi:hypothetical protein DVS28_a0109 [Euzebya pacifica]|uniref:Uncharacterized protein n=1 Tax=Euzebya pacifica TaxID=1608957 RepID=A0A346XRH0_9ACTN|nr:hypothetical protein DVS28_a0109 [Euzebya pacifica]
MREVGLVHGGGRSRVDDGGGTLTTVLSGTTAQRHRAVRATSLAKSSSPGGACRSGTEGQLL